MTHGWTDLNPSGADGSAPEGVYPKAPGRAGIATEPFGVKPAMRPTLDHVVQLHRQYLRTPDHEAGQILDVLCQKLQRIYNALQDRCRSVDLALLNKPSAVHRRRQFREFKLLTRDFLSGEVAPGNLDCQSLLRWGDAFDRDTTR